MAKPEPPRRKKSSRRRRAAGGRGKHPQKPPHCCQTHAAASAIQGAPCWDCQTLDLAETVSGLAQLLGWGSCGVTALAESHGTTASVLDCLIAAEELLLERHCWHTRQGRRAAGGL